MLLTKLACDWVYASCHPFFVCFALGYKTLSNIETLLHFLFRESSDITRFPYTLLAIFTVGLLVPPNFHFLFSKQ